VRDLAHCVVLLPFCPGSALLHRLHDCAIVLGCHQFRMHDADAVDVFLRAGSNPVIEGCARIRFAMYPAKLAPELLQQPPLPPFAIQDFSHIRSSPSPNFSLMPDKLGVEAKPWPVERIEGREELEKALAVLLPPKDVAA